MGGGLAVNDGGTVDLYTTSFSGNTADGVHDIDMTISTVTIHASCGPGATQELRLKGRHLTRTKLLLGLQPPPHPDPNYSLPSPHFSYDDSSCTPFDDCDCPDGWSCDESQMRRLEKKHLRNAGRRLFGVEVPHYCVVTAN